MFVCRRALKKHIADLAGAHSGPPLLYGTAFCCVDVWAKQGVRFEMGGWVLLPKRTVVHTRAKRSVEWVAYLKKKRAKKIRGSNSSRGKKLSTARPGLKEIPP